MLDLAEGPLLTSHPKACDLVGSRVVEPEPGAPGGSPGRPWQTLGTLGTLGMDPAVQLTFLRSEKELEAQCGGFDQWR